MKLSDTNDTAARLRRSITRLNRRLRQSSLGGISPAQASLLATVNKLEAPSLGDLALAEQIQPPSVTKLVRNLEQDGFLMCYPDASDRRCTRVILTILGEKEVKEIRARKTEFLEQRLALLSETDQRRMSELAELLESLLES